MHCCIISMYGIECFGSANAQYHFLAKNEHTTMISIYRCILAVMAMICITNENIYAIERVASEENIIEEYEGFSANAYIDSNGKKAIGYGHTIRAYEHYKQLTPAKSESILIDDIKDVESFINQVVTVDLSQGQLSALTSLIYNWGSYNFLKSQGLKYLNQSMYEKAAQEFFSKERGVVNINGKFSSGLYKRRQAELELWNDQT